MNPNLWVELVGDLIVARVRGEPTIELLRECQSQVVALAREARRYKVLYDTLEMLAPPVAVAWSQRDLDEQLGELNLQRAIVVPNSKLAYLARLAFGEGNYRVFYNDMLQPLLWLSEAPPDARLTLVR